MRSQGVLPGGGVPHIWVLGMGELLCPSVFTVLDLELVLWKQGQFFGFFFLPPFTSLFPDFRFSLTCEKFVLAKEARPFNGFLISPISAQAKMPFDANKLYCSEVLAILLQDNDGEAPSQYWYSVRIGARLVSDHDSKLSCLWHPLASPLALCAAFVLCQAVLILFADVSVLDGCKIWQLASFFFLPLFFSPFRKQGIAWGAGWNRCASSAVIRE